MAEAGRCCNPVGRNGDMWWGNAKGVVAVEDGGEMAGRAPVGGRGDLSLAQQAADRLALEMWQAFALKSPSPQSFNKKAWNSAYTSCSCLTKKFEHVQDKLSQKPDYCLNAVGLQRPKGLVNSDNTSMR